MRKYLVPTDFSDTAYLASDLAIKLARILHAEVHFFTKVNVHPLWDDLSDKAKDDFPESYSRLVVAKDKFKVLLERYENSGVPMKTAYSTGDLLQSINKYVAEEEIRLIVMGSSGASGWKEVILGSNTQKLVRYANVPVLVVKHPVESAHFKNIVFASDFSERSKYAFERLLEVSRYFKNATLHLVAIGRYPDFELPDSVKEGKMEAYAQVARMQGLKVIIAKVEDLDRELGINHYVVEKKADVVTLSNSDKTTWKRIFSGSLVESLVNHLEIPVMVLNTIDDVEEKVDLQFFP